MSEARYVVVGDSQSEGLLFPRALPDLLGPRLVAGFDHRGWSSSRLLRDGAIGQAADAALAAGASLLLFSGGNDTAGASGYPDTLLDIVRALATKSARAGRPLRVVWFGPVFAAVSPDNEQHPATARAMASVLGSAEARQAAEVPGSGLSLRWIDSQPLTRDLAREENVHLDAAGYRTFGSRVLRAVEGTSTTAAAGGAAALLLAVGLGYWLLRGGR